MIRPLRLASYKYNPSFFNISLIPCPQANIAMHPNHHAYYSILPPTERSLDLSRSASTEQNGRKVKQKQSQKSLKPNPSPQLSAKPSPQLSANLSLELMI